MYVRVHVKYPLFLSDFNETWIFWTFSSNAQISRKSAQWETSSMWKEDKDRPSWPPPPSFLLPWRTAQHAPGQGRLILEVSRSDTMTYQSVDSSELVISPSQRPLHDNTQNSKETGIHASGGIRTHNRSKWLGADPRLRPLGHWDRPWSPSAYRNLHSSWKTRDLHQTVGTFIVLDR